MKRVTLKQVAKLAGLSVSGAARALRGKPDFPLATRVRVQAAAKQLGYHPDPMLSALSIYRQAHKPKKYQGTLAFLSARYDRRTDEKSYLENRETGDLLRGARERAHSLGYRLEYIHIDQNLEGQRRIWKTLYARGVSGALVRSYPLTPEELYLPLDKLTCIDLFSAPSLRNIPAISNYHAQSMKLVLEKLFQRGYRHPALLLRKDLSQYLDHGWRMAFQTFASWFTDASIYSYDSWPVNFVSVVSWMNRHKVDVILHCDSHDILPGLQKTKGFSLRKTGVVCMDLLEPNCNRGGIYQDRIRAGATAIEWLHAMLITGQVGTPLVPAALLLPGVFKEGLGVRATS